MVVEDKDPNGVEGTDDQQHNSVAKIFSEAGEAELKEEDLEGTPRPSTDEEGKTSIQGAVPISGKSKLLLKKLFGSKQKQIMWGVGFVLVIGASFGGLALKSHLEEQAELHETASSNYMLAKTDFNDEVRLLEDAISAGQTLSMATKESDVMDSLVLADLDEVLSVSDSENWSAAPLSGADELSTEELRDITKSLRSDRGAVADLTFAIQAATIVVEESKAKKAEELAAAAKQAKIDAAGAISYEELARGGDSLIGNYYWFEGEVIQDAGAGSYRISITKDPGYSRVFWKDPILVTVMGETSQKLLEDDVVSFLASSLGTESYTSIFGQEISLPLVVADGSNITVTGRTN